MVKSAFVASLKIRILLRRSEEQDIIKTNLLPQLREQDFIKTDFNL